jgi:Na+/H+-dicarboxylate symporter
VKDSHVGSTCNLKSRLIDRKRGERAATAGALLSFGVPAVPVGGLLLLAPVFATTRLPVEGVGILMAVDLIPDISRTVLNVTPDMAVATILSRRPSRHATELPHAVTAETADNSPS